MNFLRRWWRAWRLRREVEHHLRLYGCALFCPKCGTLLQRDLVRHLALDNPPQNGIYRYRCDAPGCGYWPEFDFAHYPVPICTNKP